MRTATPQSITRTEFECPLLGSSPLPVLRQSSVLFATKPPTLRSLPIGSTVKVTTLAQPKQVESEHP
jgi:hypothetical protein